MENSSSQPHFFSLRGVDYSKIDLGTDDIKDILYSLLGIKGNIGMQKPFKRRMDTGFRTITEIKHMNPKL